MERRSLLLFVDEWVRATHEPVLVPDVRSLYAFVLPQPNVSNYSPTFIFHTLRDMVADGLITHSRRGYELTDEGRDEAEQLRVEKPEVAQRAAAVVGEYAVQ